MGLEMASSFQYLLACLTYPDLIDSGVFAGEKTPLGEFQYYGPHFLVAIRYALKLDSNNNDEFNISLEKLLPSDLWTRNEGHPILGLMAHILTRIGEFFTVQNSNTVEITESFIEFLVQVLEILSSRSFDWIIIPTEINILRRRIQFLLIVIQDTPFQLCTELKERKNIILGEIECVANEVGVFLYSFFFTTNHVSMTEMNLELYVLLSKLDAVEETVKNRFVMFLEQPVFTTSDYPSTWIDIVDSVLADLNHLLNLKADLLVEITTLHDELYSCRSMLRDIELPQSKELEECETQLIDVAYQAEHLIACFAAGDLPVWYLAPRLASFIQISKPIRISLTTLKLNSSTNGVQVAENSSKVSSSQVASEGISTTDDDIIIGFKEVRRNIASELIGGPNRLQIRAIIGMGGLGKTTIARKLYNDPNVVLHFDRRCWCTVSQTYNKRKLLNVILSSVSMLNKDEISKMEEHQLAERVYKSLKGIRYLLVMDDIWEKQAWDDLKKYFPDDSNGSRILFTSRNKDVALQDSTQPIIHDLPVLSADECWNLLQKPVFPNSFCPQELEDVGKEVARNCKGLPLAVVGIAAVLAKTDKKESLWKEIATKLSSYISKDGDILELSYWHLPSDLKPCFLFLGMFEEDKEIVARELLFLWVSAGLIPKNEHKIPEDIAEKYLLELINRNMVQVLSRRSDNGVKSFTMHDLMRDMCLRLGDTGKFVKVMNEKSSTHEQHHHIYIEWNSDEFTPRPFGAHIRSLFSNVRDFSFITPSMKRLRILKLSNNIGISCGKTLEFLFHLRHLESDGTIFDFQSHVNLEFLSLGHSLRENFQLNMPKLRHLEMGPNPEYIPLKALDMSQVDSLQTLSGLAITDLEDVESLRRFSQLHRLKCRYGSYTEECSPCSLDFTFLTQLVSLSISSTKFLPIKLKVTNFPIHIKRLSISQMILSCTMLSSIGTLAHLEILKLHCIQFEETRWNTNEDEFQALKFLKLDCVVFDEWNTSEDHFPVLEQLVLRDCRRLKLIPFDLGYIPTLQKIEVLDCTEDVRNFARHIQEEQEEAGNEQLKVIIVSGAISEEEDEDGDGDDDEEEDGDREFLAFNHLLWD